MFSKFIPNEILTKFFVEINTNHNTDILPVRLVTVGYACGLKRNGRIHDIQVTMLNINDYALIERSNNNCSIFVPATATTAEIAAVLELSTLMYGNLNEMRVKTMPRKVKNYASSLWVIWKIAEIVSTH